MFNNFAIVGSCPNSGSTLLADLLDSTPRSVCGPELNLFSNINLYTDFSFFRENPYTVSESSSIHKMGNQFNYNRICDYGINTNKFLSFLREANSAKQFLDDFGVAFSTFREKDNSLWFEKTPQNVVHLDYFHEIFPEAYYIHITRNPIYVIHSLRKRGFSPLLAALTWYFDNLHYLSKSRPNQCFNVKYEELIEKPWDITANIVSWISGHFIEPGVIKQCYMNNSYRPKYSKSYVPYGDIINANRKDIDDEILSIVNCLLQYTISDSWANTAGLKVISYQNVLREFDYYDEILDLVRSHDKYKRLPFRKKDIIFLFKKWRFTRLNCPRYKLSLGKILFPVKKISS